MAPAAIDAKQAIKAKTEAEIVSSIEAALDGLAESKTPIDIQSEYAEAIFDRVTEKLAASLADDLEFGLGDWKSNPRRDLALALMSSNLQSAVGRS